MIRLMFSTVVKFIFLIGIMAPVYLNAKVYSGQWPMISGLSSSDGTFVTFSTKMTPVYSSNDVPLDCSDGSTTNINCVLGIMYRANDGSWKQLEGGQSGIGGAGISGDRNPTDKTWGDFFADARPGSMTHFALALAGQIAGSKWRMPPEGSCVAFVVREHSFGSYGEPQFPFGRSLNEYCLYVPPANVSCNWASENLELDYGFISANKVSGAEISKNIILTCSKAVSVRFYMSELTLTNGMVAKLTINGKSLNTSTSINAGGQVMKFKSILTGVPFENYGRFSGSSILLTQYD